MSDSGNPPPGWFPDPTGAPQSRWWDGVQWHEATQALEVPQPVAPATAVPAGWYPDPEGHPQNRWWDGVEWHSATQQPAAVAVAVAVAEPPVPTYASMAQAHATPVVPDEYRPMSGLVAYNQQPGSVTSSPSWPARFDELDPSTSHIWAIAWFPLLSIAGVLVLVALRAFDPASDTSFVTPIVRGSGIGAALAIISLAYNDSRQLRERGFEPFGWGWVFLGVIVYMIGRAATVHQQSGRGLAPLFVWLGATVLSAIVTVTIVVIALQEVL